MHRSEVEQLIRCIQCGVEVWPERDRCFLISETEVLCHACASERGGVYDEVEDRWLEPPHLEGLTLRPE